MNVTYDMAITPRQKLALFFAHPYWLIVVALAGACVAVEYSIMYKANSQEMRVSLLAAITIGLPAVLYTKRLVRGHLPFYAEYSFVIGDRAVQLEYWRRNWKNLYANVPLTLALVATWLAARHLHVHWMPMLGMMLILCILLYPEQEEIHARIKERIGRMSQDGES